MPKALDEIVDEGDQLIVLPLQVHQARLDLALHTHCVYRPRLPAAQSGSNRLWPCHGGRQGDFLQPCCPAPFQPLHQIRQMTATVSLQELVYLIDDEHLQRRRRNACTSRFGLPSMTSSDSGVVSSTSACSGRQTLDIPSTDAQAQPQAFVQDRLQPTAQVLRQGACRHHVQDRRGPRCSQHPLHAGRQHRLGFATARGGLQNDILALQDRRDDVTLEGTQSGKGAIEGTVGIGKLQERGSGPEPRLYRRA